MQNTRNGERKRTFTPRKICAAYYVSDNMKILVFSDIHGSVSAMETAVEISKRERPEKTVICGDLFGGWTSCEQIAESVGKLDGILYVLRGNNDGAYYDAYLPDGFEDNAVMYHFGRTVFFTHGHRYNGFRVPPVLRENDVLVYGHTHVNSIVKRNGLFVANVGSLARPRDGEKSYLILDEQGLTLKRPDGTVIYSLDWN